MKMKILNNLLSVSTIYLTAETYRIGMEHGMPLEAIAEAINEGSGRNFWTADIEDVARQYAGYTSSSAYYATFLDITRKDLALARELGADVQVRTPILEAVHERVATLDPSEVEYDNMRSVAKHLGA
jgi:3-hydroxyisobutyrate dehydrogenase-like beta-hydroxyacid dehydrogenase